VLAWTRLPSTFFLNLPPRAEPYSSVAIPDLQLPTSLFFTLPRAVPALFQMESASHAVQRRLEKARKAPIYAWRVQQGEQ
jgi:hypothetical protein